MTPQEVKLITQAVANINALPLGDVRIMEVCGTHTHQIARLGLKRLLSPNIRLISGPGCPVCVTPSGYLDALITLLQHKNMVVATFGDLLRVPGSLGSLEVHKGENKNLLTVYSPEDALDYAQCHPEKQVVFAAVGFETSAPMYAALIKHAQIKGVQNLTFLTALKRMSPVMRYLLSDSKTQVDGFLCPGHVAAVTGMSPFAPIAEEYGIPAVICGFEATDIVAAIGLLCQQLCGKRPVRLENAYRRCVNACGNRTALDLMDTVFEISGAFWRGIGEIAESGLTINPAHQAFDAQRRFGLTVTHSAEVNSGCACGAVLTGIILPDVCRHFGTICTPEHPLGPCMVSSEGACAAFYRYGGVAVANDYTAAR